MTNFTVNFNYVIEVHENLVQDKHCIAGIRDENLLISAIEGQYWYEVGVEQIIHVAYSICANHVFTDGNKRTAFLTLKLLETQLGYICDWENIAYVVLDLATYSTEKLEFHKKIKNLIFDL